MNPDGDVTLAEADVAAFRMAGCERCGSALLKPDVVYFGEPVPAERRDAAFALLGQARSLVVAGSSLAVMSGYRFVLEAKKQGKRVAVINGGPAGVIRKWIRCGAPRWVRPLTRYSMSWGYN